MAGVIGQVLNIPVTCHPKHFPRDKYEYGSYEQNKGASVVDAPKMDWFWDQYLPDATPDPYASPLLGKDLRGLPPACAYFIFWDFDSVEMTDDAYSGSSSGNGSSER